jgi:hypothetical protein
LDQYLVVGKVRLNSAARPLPNLLSSEILQVVQVAGGCDQQQAKQSSGSKYSAHTPSRVSESLGQQAAQFNWKVA